ncbi:MAG: hypothetical protein B7X59_04235 [Polaromonas sp. 39-63-203]|jgi:flagellar protein FlaG|uniref:flagellar protein FlaG n=1 Tax=Polaromonas sp. TaxID=1869339 RepID=UPI000BD0CF34|nr:flagellar protein FlaG [Polaromonas sp.]OYY53016.1 MAG: hypothetical protein B7Y54_04730 [Polaromonas sp. 35-63-240]OYY99296.1 MAG: hypothetical protein B7Y42_06315 [Polaromonas sp. 28-63-22]OYZ84174.1 MAG: hypothetical protein B7Y03_05260 [Polaromonas sp. 24-62-144]OZA99113.1 MAG: hypothetical protein B7X59_04235 [Polaromonas sp. 39-63-203]HQS31597.1 flagellar protein FlaG [Polaromonas sp.]
MMIPARAATASPRRQPMSASTPLHEDRIALAEINEAFQMSCVGLQFAFDQQADEMVAKVLDVGSGAVIRQIPFEEVARISKAMGKLQSLLMHQSILKKWGQSRRPLTVERSPDAAVAQDSLHSIA